MYGGTKSVQLESADKIERTRYPDNGDIMSISPFGGNELDNEAGYNNNAKRRPPNEMERNYPSNNDINGNDETRENIKHIENIDDRENIENRENRENKDTERAATVADVGIINPFYRNGNSKDLNVNRYATKKTIAQGMLDIALLTANASQLRYVLAMGQNHEFYAIMLGLIITSITLQLVVATFSLSLSMLRDCCVDDKRYHDSGQIINSFNMIAVFLISVLNVLITGFGVFDNPTYYIIA